MATISLGDAGANSAVLAVFQIGWKDCAALYTLPVAPSDKLRDVRVTEHCALNQ